MAHFRNHRSPHTDHSLLPNTALKGAPIGAPGKGRPGRRIWMRLPGQHGIKDANASEQPTLDIGISGA